MARRGWQMTIDAKERVADDNLALPTGNQQSHGHLTACNDNRIAACNYDIELQTSPPLTWVPVQQT